MKYLCLALLVLLYACTNTISRAHYEIAIKLCEPNGGLDGVETEYLRGNERRITAYCANGVTAKQDTRGIK